MPVRRNAPTRPPAMSKSSTNLPTERDENNDQQLPKRPMAPTKLTGGSSGPKRRPMPFGKL